MEEKNFTATGVVLPQPWKQCNFTSITLVVPRLYLHMIWRKMFPNIVQAKWRTTRYHKTRYQDILIFLQTDFTYDNIYLKIYISNLSKCLGKVQLLIFPYFYSKIHQKSCIIFLFCKKPDPTICILMVDTYCTAVKYFTICKFLCILQGTLVYSYGNLNIDYLIQF